MKRILLVEDDRDLGEGLTLGLRGADTDVALRHDLAGARAFLAAEAADLILLDLNLPDGSGLDLLREVRASSASPIPVILLTANDTEMDVVRGLEQGADDYITKPFSLAILRARVNARLRGERFGVLRIDGFLFDFGHMEFSVSGEPVELSKTEQKLLRLLVENRGGTVPRDTLLDRVWGGGLEYVDENTLSVAVKRLRDKLGAGGYIRTVYGVGYTWAVRA